VSNRKKKKKKKKKQQQQKRVGREKVGGVRETWWPLQCVCGCGNVRKCSIKFLREKEEEEEEVVYGFVHVFSPELQSGRGMGLVREEWKKFWLLWMKWEDGGVWKV
jgi:hypothetical protein